jgi:peptide subunit release factor 1 (eRF1)
MQLLADPIADLRSPSGALISLYVDRPDPGGFGALLSDLLKPVREEANRKSRTVQKSVRSDWERIHHLVDRLETEAAPAYAIFASHTDGVFVLEQLTRSVPNASTLGPRPYLRPLRAAPRPFRTGVIVADRALARVFVSSNGLVEELGDPLAADIGKTNYGGFSGYEEHGVRSHADEASSRMWKSASARLLDAHQERPVDYLAIGGHDETVDEIGRTLHPYLSRLYRATFTASPQALTPASLRAEILDLSQEVRARRQAAIAGRVCDTAWSGGNAVLGLNATLDACNAQAVDTLVVAGQFLRPGSICNECGHLSRTAHMCPVCGARMFEVDDVVGAAMDATVAAGGLVHQIEVASSLDVDGIGALTRFQTAS